MNYWMNGTFCLVLSNIFMLLLVGRWKPRSQNKAGAKQAHQLLFMKPCADSFPLTMSSVTNAGTTLYLWSGCLWGVQTILQTWSHSCCLKSSIQLQDGSLFQTRQTISFRCTLRIIHSPVTGSPPNGSRIAAAGKEVGGNGNFLNL